jgi:hypothetical protein
MQDMIQKELLLLRATQNDMPDDPYVDDAGVDSDNEQTEDELLESNLFADDRFVGCHNYIIHELNQQCRQYHGLFFLKLDTYHTIWHAYCH